MLRKFLVSVALLASGLAQAGPTILVYGDSLSAAYGISQKDGWVTLLQERLKQMRLDYTVVNASISGETTSGGASRIAATLDRHQPAIVIVALGSNDGLRGLPVKQMRDNLSQILGASRKAGSKTLLAGMRLPPNYGARYAKEFEEAFDALAKSHRSALVPFLLEGVAGHRDLFLDDNLHPTARAQPIVLENVWKALRPLLN